MHNSYGIKVLNISFMPYLIMGDMGDMKDMGDMREKKLFEREICYICVLYCSYICMTVHLLCFFVCIIHINGKLRNICAVYMPNKRFTLFLRMYKVLFSMYMRFMPYFL